MAHVILNVKDNKLSFFFEFIKNFRFIKVEKTISDDEPSKEEVIKNIKLGLIDIKNIEQGKSKSRPAKDLLNEL
ncbi:MAG: hypothetical protein WC868_03760 [Bacteroidales bacterium]